MRLPEERSFCAPDGTSLFYRHWPADNVGSDEPRAIILLHRGHEHSGRMQHIVDELEMPDCAMFAWDARGHGKSPLKQDDRPTLGTFVKDLDAFAQHVSCAYGVAIEDIAVVAQSVGSVLAAAWVHDYAPPIRCMVLASPAFKVKLYVPFSRAILGLVLRAKPDLHVKSYVKPAALTHDKERIESYASDPLITRPISVRVLLGLFHCSPDHRGCTSDSGAGRAPDFRLGLGRPQTAATRFFNASDHRSKKNTCSMASITTRWVSATVILPLGRSEHS